MTLLLLNLLAYSAQVAVIVGVGGTVITLLRLGLPRVRFATLWILLGVCLASPLFGPRAVSTTNTDLATTVVPVTFDTATVSSAHQTRFAGPLPRVIVGLLVGGAMIRLF